MLLAESVYMRVIPIQAGRLCPRNLYTIFKRWIAGLDQGFQRFILMTNRRNRQAMEMKIY